MASRAAGRDDRRLQLFGGGGPDSAGLISTGTGTFSFADGLSAVGLTDLTSFDFTLNENTPNTATFGLSELTSFSASVGPGSTLTNLALATSSVQGSNQDTFPRGFVISSLSSGGASSSFEILGVSFQLTDGTATINSVTTTVPEPSAFTLVVLGALIIAGGCFRRRNARAVC